MYGTVTLKEAREKCADLFGKMDAIITGAKKEGRELRDNEVRLYESWEKEYDEARILRDSLDRHPRGS